MKKSLVFVHGLGLGSWIFEEKYLSYYRQQGYQVHAVNLPSHYTSSTNLERQRVSLDTCVEFVERYIGEQVKYPFVIVGMSMGGAICQRILAKESAVGNMAGAVLMCSVPPTNSLTFTLRLCRKMAISNPDVLIDFFTEKTNPKLFFSTDTLKDLSQKKIQGYLERVLTGFSLLEYEVFFKDLIANPFELKIPIKIIGGEDDMLFPPEVIQFTAAYYSQEFEIIKGLGHMIPFETNYLAGIKSIDKFLNEVLP